MYIFRQTRSYVYVTHRHNLEIQNALVSKPRTLLNWKVLTNSVPLRQTSAFSSVSLTQHEKFFARHAVSCTRGAALTSLHIDLHPHPQKKITCTTGVFLFFCFIRPRSRIHFPVQLSFASLFYEKPI